MHSDDEIMNAPISILQLSRRAAGGLASNGIKTVRDLLAYSEAELLRTWNFGRMSMGEVKRALERNGCHLRTEVTPVSTEELIFTCTFTPRGKPH
jgi:DNA-directed RNA polymerase alpha subunit